MEVWNGIWKKILVWNGIWKKILVWNGIWNGRFLVWNGRKLPVWNMEKSSSIPFHTMPCFLGHSSEKKQFQKCKKRGIFSILHCGRKPPWLRYRSEICNRGLFWESGGEFPALEKFYFFVKIT